MYRLLLAGSSKGGSGKTTTASNTAVELARLGHRVLLIGVDPSGDLETSFGITPGLPGATYLDDLLTRGGEATPLEIEVPAIPPAGPFRRKRKPATAKGTLAIIPSTPALGEEAALIAAAHTDRLHQLLVPLDGSYDFALIDAVGADITISDLALAAADGALFVGEPGRFELDAVIRRLARFTTFKNARGNTIDQVGVLFTRTDPRSAAMRDYAENYGNPEQFNPPLFIFAKPIRQQASVHDHPNEGQPTVIADPHSNAAVDYRRFAAELVTRAATFTRVKASARAPKAAGTFTRVKTGEGA
jgi:chromosome partitioning protein